MSSRSSRFVCPHCGGGFVVHSSRASELQKFTGPVGKALRSRGFPVKLPVWVRYRKCEACGLSKKYVEVSMDDLERTISEVERWANSFDIGEL